LGQRKKSLKMKENYFKYNYESPVVEVMTVRVEAGFQGSNSQGNANTTRYGADSWDTPSGNPNARYN
jgi:hypothetical protein